MRHRATIDLETKLLAARGDILERGRATTELHARRVEAARAHALDRAAAAAALEAIAKTRSYRLGGHRSFGAFVAAELGISRATAARLRAFASAPPVESERAARTLERWLRAQGLVSARVSAPAHRAGRLHVVIDVGDVARVAAVRKRARRV